MDALALPKVVSSKADGKVPDLERRVKELLRGQQKKKVRGTKVPVVPSVDIPRLASEGVEHVEALHYPTPFTAPFRCHACGELCIGTVPKNYPVSLTHGRDLLGHDACLYRYGLTRRHVIRDNGLITLMLAGRLPAPLTLIQSAFVFRAIQPRQTRDTFLKS